MPAKPTPAFSLWQLVAIDGMAVGGVILLHTMLPESVPTAVHVAEALAIGGAGAACAYFWWKLARRETPTGTAAAPLDNADLEILRKETSENLRVIQQDIQSLGAAMIKRFAASTKPEVEHFEAIAGTVTDLAISLAEARETLATLSADLGETKSAAFEMQAQIDWLSDSLRAHGGPAETAATTEDAGEGAAPGSLGKALAFGVTGQAVARLIGNGAPKAPSVSDEPTEPVAPLASTDIEGAYDSGDEILPSADFAIDTDTMEPEWEAPGEDYPELRDPLPDTFARVVAPEPKTETQEQPANRIGLDGVNEDDYVDSNPATLAAVAGQPDLLALDSESDTRKKPRKPGKTDTALIAHVMIGIGNKPYLRGIGPGLSPEKGVPMDYVDVGRWQWICTTPGQPVTVSIWKNDEEPADGDLIDIPMGTTLEIHPQFSH